MKLEELYAKYDEIVGKMNVNPIDHFIFDLTDENSQKSLKDSFPGIESILMPESGKYLVVSPIVEDQNCLVLMFPQQTDGSLGLWVYNTKTKGKVDLIGGSDGDEKKTTTLDNFTEDFARMEEITKKFNEFVFMGQNGEISLPTEVKDIGSFDISNDEPVELNNTTTDNEENEMTFKPIQEESLDSELKDTKWVEIPNTNAHGVTVTEDDGAAPGGEDPFADGSSEGDAPAGDAATADASADASADAPADGGETPVTTDTDAAAEPAPEAPAEEAPTENIDDPKAKMRELLAYYTNYMNELVQDPNTSTDLISATQEMIDSLIKNMESADGIEEVKAEAEEAAKEEVSAEEAPPEDTPAEEAPAEEAPPEGGATAPAEEPVAETTQENPITDIPIQEDKQENPITDIPIQEDVDAEQKAIDDKIDAEVDDLHKDDWEDIQPATSDNILTPGDIQNSVVNDVDISNMVPSPEEELATTTPDETVPAPTSDVLDDTALPTPDEEDALFDDGANDFSVGADGLPLDTFDGDLDNLGLATPASKKIQWSSDYATNGVATTDDNNVVVPEVLTELQDYYKKVADEVSKVPGKEDVAMKLQKIQILSQTIQTEWNNIASQIGDVSANTFDRSIMGDLEKDEIDQAPAMDQVGADVLADQEAEEEDDLKVASDIAAFCESFKHLL